jgi:hypothetical protein
MAIYSEKCPHCSKEWPLPHAEARAREEAQKEMVETYKAKKAWEKAKRFGGFKKNDTQTA